MGGVEMDRAVGFLVLVFILSRFSGTAVFCFNAANMECPCLGTKMESMFGTRKSWKISVAHL